jgi:hypothetical protein
VSGPKVLGQPEVWIQCTCGTPYVYRQCFTFGASGSGVQWLWQRDCKNTRNRPAKEHQPKPWCADGQYVDG